MTVARIDDISIDLTSVFMKLVGFWLAANRGEQRLRNATLIYTLIAILFALWIQSSDIYHQWGDFGACLYTACNIMSLTLPLFKILVLLAHRKTFFYLIVYMQRKFLHANYDSYEKSVLIDCKRKCTFFVCFLTFFSEATVVSYTVSPIFANIGRNESDRVLPFNMWVDLPLTMTPYYEITFVLQTLSLYHIGVCYFCFDNFLCIMSMHVAGQYRILQHRLSNMRVVLEKMKQGEKFDKNTSQVADDYYTTFKGYIRQHQMLIDYCNKLEEVFNLIVLGQVTMFSLLICLDGYQILMRVYKEECLLRARMCARSQESVSMNKVCLRRIESQWAAIDLRLQVWPWNERDKYAWGKGWKTNVRGTNVLWPGWAESADAPTRRRITFIFHITACICQLFMFTYGCDCIIRESTNLAAAVYSGPWSVLPMNARGRILRKDLVLVIMRSNAPCCLTARGFFIVSLETYTRILSTAASYFTLLKQRMQDAESV